MQTRPWGLTSFQVQRSILVRDSPVFSTLFALPQGQLPAEGTSDAAPIVLAGDSAEDVRAMLKYLNKPSVLLPPFRSACT